MGESDTSDKATTTAAARLRLLDGFLTPHRTAPDGQPRARSQQPAVPIDLTVLDHVERTVAEVGRYVRTVIPDPPPAPRGAEHLYAYLEQHTAHLDTEQAQARDAMVARQSLEHAIAAGNEHVIRHIACPGCECWSLLWKRTRARAVCANRRCARLFTLAQLAEAEVGNSLARTAT